MRVVIATALLALAPLGGPWRQADPYYPQRHLTCREAVLERVHLTPRCQAWRAWWLTRHRTGVITSTFGPTS